MGKTKTDDRDGRVEKFNGRLGKRFKVLGPVSPTGGPTPHTPSVTYTRSRQKPPDVWETKMFYRHPSIWRTFSSSDNKLAVVKSSQHVTGRKLLENENKALARLQNWAWLPGRRVAPRLYHSLTYDTENNRWFIASEWLGMKDNENIKKGAAWERLKTILDNRYRWETAEILQLQRALEKAVRIMHRRGVIHGDIKDEHVFVKVKDPQNPTYDFTTVRLVDFGLSYLETTSVWKGASLGFCHPHFWASKTRGMSKNELQWLDLYAVDALLYLVLTDEHFPAAFPAYKDVLQPGPDGDTYSRELEEHLNKRFRIRNSEQTRRIFARWLIHRLCATEHKNVYSIPLYQEQLTTIIEQPASRVWLWFLGISLGGFALSGALSRVFPIPYLYRFGLISLLLSAFREMQQESFIILDRTRPEKNLWANVVQASGSIWSILGSVVFPRELLPVVPAVTALFVQERQNKGAIFSGISVLIAAFIAWARLTIGPFDVFTLSAGYEKVLTTPVGLWVITAGWLLSYGIVLARFKAKKPSRRLWMVIASALGAWAFPAIFAQIVLLLPVHWFSLEGLLSAMSSVVFGVLAGLYAIWSTLVDINGKYE